MQKPIYVLGNLLDGTIINIETGEVLARAKTLEALDAIYVHHIGKWQPATTEQINEYMALMYGDSSQQIN